MRFRILVIVAELYESPETQFGFGKAENQAKVPASKDAQGSIANLARCAAPKDILRGEGLNWGNELPVLLSQGERVIITGETVTQGVLSLIFSCLSLPIMLCRKGADFLCRIQTGRTVRTPR